MDLKARAGVVNAHFDARIFLQCRNERTLMYEFWTDDHDAILGFCEQMASDFDAELVLCDLEDGTITLEMLAEHREAWK